MAEETIALLPVVKLFTRENVQSARYSEQVDRLMQLSTRQQLIYAALDPAMQFLAAAGIVVLVWLAKDRLGSGVLSTGDFVGFMLYAALLARPMSSLAAIYGRTQMTRGALARLEAVLDEPLEPRKARALDIKQGEIEFRYITFSYPSGHRRSITSACTLSPARRLRSPELTARQNTLVNLLLRLHTPDLGNDLHRWGRYGGSEP